MKRIGSSESNNALEEVEEKAPAAIDGTDQETEFCDEEDEDELCGNGGGGGLPSSSLGEKKRRLGVDQVKALQNNFQVDNKLDPERKLRLAQDLGLQPRQVAVWFQNRRARWKTKLLERDFSALRDRHDALKSDCDDIRRDNHGLLAQIAELKAKLSMTEAMEASEERPPLMYNYKDGASDSDSSCVVFDDEAPEHEHRLMGFKSSSCEKEFAGEEHVDEKGGCQHQLDDEEFCSSFFSEQPAATSLSTWYSSHQWN